MSDKIRKYVLPNLPYLFVFWFFSKIGTAYRIAPGTDFGTKLMGMLDTFPKAFETYWPGWEVLTCWWALPVRLGCIC